MLLKDDWNVSSMMLTTGRGSCPAASNNVWLRTWLGTRATPQHRWRGREFILSVCSLIKQ